MSDDRPLPAWAEAIHDLIVENLRALGAVADQIGPEQINVVPPLPQANSGYAIVWHCAQMSLFWAGSVIGGERIPRDRDAEFTATGTLDRLHAALDDVADRMHGWVSIAATEGARDRTVVGSTRSTAVAEATPEWMLAHMVRELSQHLGQLEVTRDVLATAP